jgi:stearoyl-CoA desaturase (delta-9 desaturase)
MRSSELGGTDPRREVTQTSKMNVPITTFLLGSPILAGVLAVSYTLAEGFALSDVLIFLFMYYGTGLAITAGYHRYYAHRTYDCHPIVQFLLLAFGAATFQNSVLNWASDHRYHHQYADKDGDPYAVNKGFWWAHMGWMFFFYPENRPYRNSVDLKNDRLVMWQEKYYLPLALVMSFGLPMALGALFGRPMGGLIWGGAVRLVVVHQVTFMINSVAHTFGRKTYSKTATARDNNLLALFTFGEGYHSYHHAFAGDYRLGVKWYQYDPGKWLIRTLNGMGLAKRLKRVPLGARLAQATQAKAEGPLQTPIPALAPSAPSTVELRA